MLIIWVVFALLTGLAVFAVLWPLSRPPVTTDARELDVAFYKAQTAEIERDATRGVIGEAEAETARNEAARRLMAAAQRPSGDVRGSSPMLTRTVALGTMLFVPALTLMLYHYVGKPNLPDEPLAARLEAAPSKMDMATAIARIEQHLAQNPDDARGWTVIAPIYVRLGRIDDARRAYANIIRLKGPDADAYAGLGEAQMYASSGVVTADAKKSFEQAIAVDPASPRANFYLGTAAQQDGDTAKALAIWRKLVAASPPEAAWLPTVKAHIAEVSGEPLPESPGTPLAESARARPGPASNPQMASAVAAMPKDQQQAMIHRMVDGLADRLKTNGNDIDGWLRLVRAYRVLDEQGKAKSALGDARRNFAADATAQKRLDDLARELGLEG